MTLSRVGSSRLETQPRHNTGELQVFQDEDPHMLKVQADEERRQYFVSLYHMTNLTWFAV